MANKRDRMNRTPRAAAHALLMGVTEEGRLLPELTAVTADLSAPDRARAQRIATQTLRALDRADRMLKPFLTKRPPLAVRNLLRLGTVEIAQGEAAHGVVNECVTIAGADRRTARLKGLVNAVLRRVDAEKHRWGDLPVPVMPRWLRRPLVEAWGNKAMAAMERAHFAGAPLDLTVRKDAAGWADRLGATLLPTGTLRLGDVGQISALDGFAEGAWWVQDAAAALPVRMMGELAGRKVLDLCAAPGGKTMQLAARGAQVTALDGSAQRLARVSENLERTGLRAEIVAADAFDFDRQGWDAILLDAPCSATGTIRRHPDLPHAKDGSEFGALIAQQERLLDHALALLKPGGLLLYCTCSLLPDEGEVQVEEALARHEGLTAIRPDAADLGVAADWITPEGGLRLRPDYWPERGGMDGFYMAALRKAA